MAKKLAKAHETNSSRQEREDETTFDNYLNKHNHVEENKSLDTQDVQSNNKGTSARVVRKVSTYVPKVVQKPGGVSLTVPNMSLTVQQAFRKSLTGIPLPTHRKFDGPMDGHAFAQMDTIEKIEYLRGIRQKATETIIKHHQQQKQAEVERQQKAQEELQSLQQQLQQYQKGGNNANTSSSGNTGSSQPGN